MRPILTDQDTLQQIVSAAVQRAVLESLPDAIKSSNRGKWLHRDEAKSEYGLTDRQLQYLRDKERIVYSQHDRRIWYLRTSLEDYFDEGRVETRKGT